MRKIRAFLAFRVLISLRDYRHSNGFFTIPENTRKSSALSDIMPESSSHIFYFESVNSTMDTARELLPLHSDKNIFVVVANEQTNGRGTKGRQWISGPAGSNMYMTAVVKLSKIPLPLNMVPLRIGTLIAPSIQNRVLSNQGVRLKWPNDILIGSNKVCGTLLEVENDHILIGIGCNVGYAPTVRDGGRSSTCLREHLNLFQDALDGGGEESKSSEGDGDMRQRFATMSRELAAECAGSIAYWIDTARDSAADVKRDFEALVDFDSPMALRKENVATTSNDGINKSNNNISTQSPIDVMGDVREEDGREGTDKNSPPFSSRGEVVKPLWLNDDGTLEVVSSDGQRKTLVADYLW